jgi:hypothetical protein
MGFSSTDDFVSEVTTNGKFWRADFNKIYTGGTVVAGRWYDLTYFGGVPPQFVHGNYIKNGFFDGGAKDWTLSAGIVWTAATSLVTKSGASSETISQNTACVNGTAYVVTYTIGSYAGSGNITISLGGTNGTNRTANGTYTETITCGATANAPLVVTVASTVSACTLDTISVVQALAFTPYTDASENGLWHAGNVSSDTKHLINYGAWTNAAVGAPSVLMLVDLLGVYPRIATNSASSQTLNNTQTLPRYTTGAGVRAFYSIDVSNGANAQNFSMVYTNQESTGSRTLGAVVANTASAVQGHISHSGVAAGNYGPFLPLSSPDTGVKSVQSVQFSAASASAGLVNLVLCKPIASIPITTGFVAAERDLMNQLPSLPKIEDGACLAFIVFYGAVATSGTAHQGYLDIAWG